MSRKRRPLQRQRTITVAIPTKQGEILTLTENLPTSQEELERTILEKFIRALASHTGRDWKVTARDDSYSWPDFVVTENGAQVGVEITEILPKAAVELELDRSLYTERILNGLKERQVDTCLPAVTVQVSDLTAGERYPQPHSKEGLSIIEQIVDEIANRVANFATLPVGHPYSWRIHLEETNHITTLNAFRRSHSTLGEPFAFKVGYGSTLPARTVNERLLNAILKKNRYAKFERGTLVLLAFTLELTDMRPQAVARAMSALGETSHPFDEIWLIRPRMDVIQNPGYEDYYPVSEIVRVWPADSDLNDTEFESSEHEFVFSMRPEEGVVIVPPRRSSPLRAVIHSVTPDIDLLPTNVTVVFGHDVVRISFDEESLPEGVYATRSEDLFDQQQEALRSAINDLRKAIAAAYFPGWVPSNIH